MSIEHKLIDWVKQVCEPHEHKKVVLGIGDDAAVVDHGDQLTVVSTDLIADNVHFCLLYTSPSPRDATLSRMPSSA